LRIATEDEANDQPNGVALILLTVNIREASAAFWPQLLAVKKSRVRTQSAMLLWQIIRLSVRPMSVLYLNEWTYRHIFDSLVGVSF